MRNSDRPARSPSLAVCRVNLRNSAVRSGPSKSDNWPPGGQRQPAGRLQGVEDQLFSSQGQEAPVPVIVVGRPAQHLQADPPGGELPQPLAGPVPVDQEDQPRSQEGQVGQQVGLVPGRVGPQAQVVEVFAEPRRPPRHRVLPAHREAVEQVLEEDQAVDVHVGVGQRDAAAARRG